MIEPPPFSLHGAATTAFMPRKQPPWLTRTSQLDLLERHLRRCSAEAQDAGVVDQHVDRPVALVRSPRPARSRTPRR